MAWLDKLSEMFKQAPRREDFKQRRKLSLKKHRVLIPCKSFPLQIHLGPSGKDKRLHIYPDIPIGGKEKNTCPDYLIFDPQAYFNSIHGFIRLRSGDKLLLGDNDKEQKRLFNYPARVKARHLFISYEKEGLVFHKIVEDGPVQIKALKKNKDSRRVCHRRLGKLRKIQKIFGAPLESLAAEQALEDLRRVNALPGEALRPKDKHDLPGGVVMVPDERIPIILGDLHAQVDNLLKILSENSFLEALENDRACLFILGDAVHSEQEGSLEDMESSLLMMDFICKLKLRFPECFFYLRGNHDSFSEEICKAGIFQGVLWKKHILKRRGEDYLREMENFYQNLPYAALGNDFIACHAGPPEGGLSREDLINIRHNPKLARGLVRSRLKRPGYPAGYTKGDVKKFRKTLKLKKNAAFIVSHNPLSEDKAVWLDVGKIPDHHIVFSGKAHSVGVFTRVAGKIQALTYPAEGLMEALKSL